MSGEYMAKASNPIRRLFLIDGIGAVVSSICLGIVLVRFQAYIGMPINVLYILALIAGIFAIYSWTCYLVYFRSGINLKIIGRLNLLYSLTTGLLVIIYFEKLTFLGLSYFIGEITILWILAFYELRTKTD